MLRAVPMRRILILPAVGLALAGPFVLGYRHSSGSRATTPMVVGSPVDEVRNAIAAQYYRPVPQKVLQLGSVNEIITALGDPYTAYLTPPAYKLVRQETASSYTGIGVSVLPSAKGFVVVALRPGPAQRAGVQVGDTIVRIGGVRTANLGMTYALSKILGRRGTRVRLELARGGHVLDLRIRRDVIRTPAVHSRLLSYEGRRWGHVRLTGFRIGTSVVLAREIRQLERHGAAGIVLDLRQNPGGLLDQAVAVSSLFLDRGVVVSLVGRHEPKEVFRAVGGVVTRLPVVVVVDRYSASAAEIVAAALRDNHRATIVGERTFGKALVQSIDPLGNGAALELTVARYYTPAGTDISHVGVAPQIVARDNRATTQDEALATALKVLARPAS
jgi:carboxyl-terminal processing protease